MPWKKPPPGFLKCNLDASLSQNLEATGLVFVIRNAEGGFIASHTMRLPGLLSAKKAKSTCLFEAFQWVKFFSMENVIFETDEKATVDAIFSSRWTGPNPALLLVFGKTF